MTDERWLAVPGYEGLYDISDLGRVRSYRNASGIQRRPQRFLKGVDSGKGYRQVALTDSSSSLARLYVHRLVLRTFKANRPRNSETDHINGVRHDNRLVNLRWLSHSQNVRRARGQSHSSSRFKGVWKKGRCWESRIYVAPRQRTVGAFATEEQAAKAYNQAALEYFGEYAYLNDVKRANP